MNRVITLLAASACAALTVSSTCFAAEWSALPFQVAKTKDAGRVQFSIAQRQGNQLARSARRLDCTGLARSSDRHVDRALAADGALPKMLETRGIDRPNRHQHYRMAPGSFRLEVLDVFVA